MLNYVNGRKRFDLEIEESDMVGPKLLPEIKFSSDSKKPTPQSPVSWKNFKKQHC